MTQSGPIIYVVDDEPSVRALVTRALARMGFDSQGFASPDDFLGRPRQDRVEVLVCDVHLADGTGLDLLAELQKSGDTMPTIFMTGAGSIPMTVQAMKLGAVEFLTKPIEWNQLEQAVAQAVTRAESARNLRAEAGRLEAMLDRLTPRERSVLPRVAQGMLNKQIAADLDIVEQTVKVHRSRIMEKLEVSSLAELVRLVDRATALGISIERELDEPG